MTLKAFLTQALRRCEAVATAEQCRTFAQPLEKRGSALCVRVRLCVSDPPVMFIFLRREGDGARVGRGRGAGPIRFVFIVQELTFLCVRVNSAPSGGGHAQRRGILELPSPDCAKLCP